MKCPFFQTECLKEECTAFEVRDKLGKYYFEKGDAGRILIKDQPYCSALNLYIPERKPEVNKYKDWIG